VAAQQDAVAEQIEEGIQALQQTALELLGQLRRPEGVTPEDTARGLLAHVDERFQALTLRMERLEGALRRLVQTLKGTVARGTEPGRQAVTGLAQRIDSLSATVQEAATRQRKDLAAFTKQTGEGLAEVAARAGEGLAQATRRQETFLDDRLEDMRRAIESLRDTEMNGATTSGQGTNGSAGGAVQARSAFTDRLDAAGERLAHVSGELAGWDPFASKDEEEQAPPAQPDPAP
jgi:CTP-dependent riboflavin kinase